MQRHPLIMLFDQAKLDNRNDMLAMPIQFTQKPSALITTNECTDFLQMNSENLFFYLNVPPSELNCLQYGCPQIAQNLAELAWKWDAAAAGWMIVRRTNTSASALAKEAKRHRG